jgi:hypothetical protein
LAESTLEPPDASGATPAVRSSGELDTELRDGRTFKLLPGMSYQVSNEGDAPHRSSTRTGAKLFIVD